MSSDPFRLTLSNKISVLKAESLTPLRKGREQRFSAEYFAKKLKLLAFRVPFVICLEKTVDSLRCLQFTRRFVVLLASAAAVFRKVEIKGPDCGGIQRRAQRDCLPVAFQGSVLLASKQRLSFLLFCDVHNHNKEPAVPILVYHKMPFVMHPDKTAVLCLYSVFTGIVISFRYLVVYLPDNIASVLMPDHIGETVVEFQPEFFFCIAQQLQHIVTDIGEFICIRGIFENSSGRGADKGVKLFCLMKQCKLCLFFDGDIYGNSVQEPHTVAALLELAC